MTGAKTLTETQIGQLNDNRMIEEYLLRMLDELTHADHRFTALARTNFQTGFMMMNRAITQPNRIEGPLPFAWLAT